MHAGCTLVLALLATVPLGCTSSVGAGGRVGGVGVGASATVTPPPERADTRLCMYDRARGELRTCLHFSFGRCELFGDRCSRETRDPAQDGSAPPAAPR